MPFILFCLVIYNFTWYWAFLPSYFFHSPHSKASLFGFPSPLVTFPFSFPFPLFLPIFPCPLNFVSSPSIVYLSFPWYFLSPFFPEKFLSTMLLLYSMPSIIMAWHFLSILTPFRPVLSLLLGLFLSFPQGFGLSRVPSRIYCGLASSMQISA